MVKCPFCGFANEDGALFCEQCKSDISSVPPAPMAPPGPPTTTMPDSRTQAEARPEAPVMAAIIEEVAVAEVIPVAPMEEPIALVEEVHAAVVVEEAKP